ncbi:hypothetical protein [Pseudotamlana agarivorans]|uniref:hypothetical protein n=1 Tax=Pseudotamlana agarivorans TaxID=481183 RepID=UPI00082FD397|nr:hypothetical protein [Tamlana agarivorans]
MKKIILYYLSFLLFLPVFVSCVEEDEIVVPDAYTETWKDEVALIFTPAVPDVRAFEYYIESGAGGQEYWNSTDVDFNVAFNLDDADLSQIAKIEFYAFAEETHGDSYKYIGGEEGKLYDTFTDVSDTMMLHLSKDKLESLFTNDFSSNHNGMVLADDFFELKWVITAKDGSVVDTRRDCLGFTCTYGIGTNIIYVAPPIWEGTFNYEWIAATTNAEIYGRISVGQVGTMTMTLKPGYFTIYDVSHLSADYFYGSGGTLDYNYETGLVKISGIDAQKWDITKVDGPTLTIDFSYSYSAGYDEYGTFTLTRTDGQDWPANIHTE